MKKLFYWLFAAILVCGGGMLTSCSNDTTDNPVVTPRERVINFEGIDNARETWAVSSCKTAASCASTYFFVLPQN